MNSRRKQGPVCGALPFLTILSLLTIGCGKSDYEAAMKSREQQLKLGSGFLETLHEYETEILGGAASLQLPTYLTTEMKELRKGDRTPRIGTPMPANRIQPPGMDIPGFDYTCELFLRMEGNANKQPIYWHFGSAPGDSSLKALEKKLAADAAKAVPKSKPTFVDVQVAKPDGSTLAYRKLTARGVQSFCADPDTTDFEDKPGEFRIYIHSAGDQHVIVAIRGTDEVIKQLDAGMKHAEYALGTLSVRGGAES